MSSRARRSLSSAPTERARRPRSGRCSICCTRRRAAPACSASTAGATAWPSASGSELPGDFAYEERMTGRALLRGIRPPARDDGPGAHRRTRRAVPGRPDRPLHGSRAGTVRRSASYRRSSPTPELLILDEADHGPRSAHAGGVPDGDRRAPRSGRRRCSCRPMTSMRSSGPCDRVGDHPRRDPSSRWRTWTR